MALVAFVRGLHPARAWLLVWVRVEDRRDPLRLPTNRFAERAIRHSDGVNAARSRSVLSGCSDQFFRLHAERDGDLLDGYVTEVVAGTKWQQYVALSLMRELQVLVLTGDDLIAVVLQVPPHFARPNR